MTVYSAQQVADIWVSNGGTREVSRVIVAVAVSKAESDWNSRAISPSGDYGLWQINYTNFPALGLNDVTALDPNRSAIAAVRMSGNGDNWAAWCTCWTDPGRDCGHGYLHDPQVGSFAGNDMSMVAYELTGYHPKQYTSGDGQPGGANAHAVVTAWGGVQTFTNQYAKARYGSLTALHRAIGRI